MNRLAHIALSSTYNQWMNGQVYAAAGQLTPRELALDRGAFFGSIIGTLNHLVVGDTLWLKRFAAHFPTLRAALQPVSELDKPTGLRDIVFDDLTLLSARRTLLDQAIDNMAKALTEFDLDQALVYQSIQGAAQRRDTYAVLCHVFNHQTHHRGQVSTLLYQAGVDVGVTDLIAIVPPLAATGSPE